MHKQLRRGAWILGGLAAIVFAVSTTVGCWLYIQLRASVARDDGIAVLEGLEAKTTVERDGLGVPSIRGAHFKDVVRATGFVHAQERYFQMDLLRRQSAGELAELLGSSAVTADRAARLHGLRSRAQAAVEALAPTRQGILQTYVAGVNAGLRELGSAPPEYLLLGTDPEPWSLEDSFLVVFTMYLRLQDPTGRREATLGTLFDVLPPEMAEFLAPRGTRWEAPLAGEPFAMPQTPSPEVVNLRHQPSQVLNYKGVAVLDAPMPGSNSWAVAGSHTADGGALIANDMHLGLGMPNIWYRLSQIWSEGDRQRQVTGVSLAGFPVVLAGSNGQIAWGFTNSQGDWADLVILDIDPSDESRYLTREGPRRFVERTETIQVKDAESQFLTVRETIWGPVVDTDSSGRPRGVRWVGHLPGAVNLGILDLIEAERVDEALNVAHRTGVPAQNLVVVDSAGSIGWTIIGPVPRRFGSDGRFPASWADGHIRWDGWLDGDSVPRIVDPPTGRIWTANARVVSGEMLEVLGDGGYALGARARQISDDLMSIEEATPQSMLGVQLDDRALFLEPWHELMLQVLSETRLARGPRIEELLRRVRDDWTGHASVDSVAYRMVRDWRSHVARRALLPLVAKCAQTEPEFNYFRIGGRFEGPLWQLVTEQPEHLLDSRYDSWDALFLDAAEGLLDELVGKELEPSLLAFTWGARNTVAVRHPMSKAVPLLSRWLDIAPRPLPGDSYMPRVQGIAMGASQRFVVSPGHEERGIFHMPAGQSGHPFSPYYRAGHDAWVEGRPAAFLPGPTAHTLTLAPKLDTAS